MDILLSICLGIGMSAACGFRVFIPLLVMSIASLSGHLTLSHGFEWIGTYTAFAVFAIAAVFEVGAYYIPWLDNLMDSITGPVTVAAGILVTASSIVHMSPLLKWSLAIIAGGGTAAIFRAVTTFMRGASTAATGGIGNPLLATAEIGIASGLGILSIAVPILGFAVVLLLIVSILFRRIWRIVVPKRTQVGRKSI